MEVKCDACGKILKRPPSWVKPHNFCSRECRKDFYRPSQICVGCGKSFPRNPLQPNDKYCSWDCFKKSRWEEVVCKQCGKTFKKRISEIQKSLFFGSEHMCSRACRNSYTSILLGGDGTWSPSSKYKGQKYGKTWPTAKRNALIRDGYQCQQCGNTDRLQVHHWEPYKINFNNDLDNLVTLCRSCHQEMHNDYRQEGFYQDVACEGRWS